MTDVTLPSGIAKDELDAERASTGRPVPARQRQVDRAHRDPRRQGALRLVPRAARGGRAGRARDHRGGAAGRAGHRGAQGRRPLRELHGRAARRACSARRRSRASSSTWRSSARSSRSSTPSAASSGRASRASCSCSSTTTPATPSATSSSSSRAASACPTRATSARSGSRASAPPTTRTSSACSGSRSSTDPADRAVRVFDLETDARRRCTGTTSTPATARRRTTCSPGRMPRAASSVDLQRAGATPWACPRARSTSSSLREPSFVEGLGALLTEERLAGVEGLAAPGR